MGSRNNKIGKYETLANDIRKEMLALVHRTKSPHIGSSYSCVEILTALYFKVLKNAVSPKKPDAFRDKFIFSKGHASPVFYTVLAKAGFLSNDDLKGFAVNGGILEQHPTMNPEKGIEVSSGSLGHGLSVGAGMALAAKKDKKKYKTYVLLSDGELNEGSVWEAAMFASHHKLDNLIAIVDHNKMQALGFTEDIIDLKPLAKKWISFGWGVKEIDGHDFNDIFRAFDSIPFNHGRPSVIIANTVKGKGVSFMENKLLWHYRAPDDGEYEKAMKELSA